MVRDSLQVNSALPVLQRSDHPQPVSAEGVAATVDNVTLTAVDNPKRPSPIPLAAAEAIAVRLAGDLTMAHATSAWMLEHLKTYSVQDEYELRKSGRQGGFHLKNDQPPESVELVLASAAERLRSGSYDGQALRSDLKSVSGHEDTFVHRLLALPLPDSNTLIRPKEQCSYWHVPSHTENLVQFADQLPIQPQHVIFDIGSGLGKPSMVLAILTGAQTRGVEYEKTYCDAAESSAQQAGIPNVEFQHADAREVDYSEGDVFHMYCPFVGPLLDEVLDKLKLVAAHKDIAIAWHGPAQDQLKSKPWLVADPNHEPWSDQAEIFYSTPDLVRAFGE